MLFIGSEEYINIPELGLRQLISKVDTGAETCAIHCHDQKRIRKKGVKYLKVTLKIGRRKEKIYFFENFTKVNVTSSNGHKAKRYKVELNIKIGTQTHIVNFTLANRKDMNFPVLLGRNLLENNYVVDVSQKFIFSKKEK